MFFVFLILLLTIYVSETNNFILKKESLGGSYNVHHNSKNVISQDDRDALLSSPTPKSIIPITHRFITRMKSKPVINNFDKKEPEEILVKRHIQGKQLPYTSPFFKSTKSTVTATLDLKRKLPLLEFGSDSDNINEYLHYFDEIEKKQLPFYHEIENAPKSKDVPQNFENRFLYQQHNYSKHLKDKALDLRSLPSQNCQNCDRCACQNIKKVKIPQIDNVHDCTRKSESITTMDLYPSYVFPTNNPLGPQSPPDGQDSQSNKDISMNFPMGIGVPVGIPFGMPAGYPGGIPVGVPANVPIAYAPGLAPTHYHENQEVTTHRKPCRHQNDHLYYNDDDESWKIYVDNDDDYNKKKRKHKGEVFVNIEYDVDETKKPNRYKPNALAPDIFKDVKKSYANTVVKKCYCNSSSSLNMNNVNFVAGFLLSILLFVKCTTAL